MKILVLGIGGIGGFFGSHLHEVGEDVSFLVREERKPVTIVKCSERYLVLYINSNECKTYDETQLTVDTVWWDPKKKKWFYDGLTTDENFKKLNELF